MIQEAINRGLSLAGLLYTQTPGFKKRSQLHDLEKKEKAIEKRRDVVSGEMNDLERSMKAGEINESTANERMEGAREELAMMDEEMQEIHRERFKIDPSKSSYRDTASIKKSTQEKMSKKAQEALMSERERHMKSRQNLIYILGIGDEEEE